jgi:hypothetical protein
VVVASIDRGHDVGYPFQAIGTVGGAELGRFRGGHSGAVGRVRAATPNSPTHATSPAWRRYDLARAVWYVPAGGGAAGRVVLMRMAARFASRRNLMGRQGRAVVAVPLAQAQEPRAAWGRACWHEANIHWIRVSCYEADREAGQRNGCT